QIVDLVPGDHHPVGHRGQAPVTGRPEHQGDPCLLVQGEHPGIVDVPVHVQVGPAHRAVVGELGHLQSRVSLRYVTRWGRAASAPRRSTLFFSYDSKLPSNQNHFAGFSSSPSQARMWVATRSRNIRSWEITTAQPGNSSSAFSKLDRVSTSRSLVGSSSSSTLPPIFRVRARLSRLRSPPDSTPTGFCWSGPLKPKAATYARDGISTLPTIRWSSPSETTSHTVLFGSRPDRVWST